LKGILGKFINYVGTCKETGMKMDSNKRHGHIPKLGKDSQDNPVRLLWGQEIITDRTEPCSKPDIILRVREGKRLVS
jgi:hypothetical protein